MSKTKLVLLTAVTAILSTWLAIGAAVGVYMVVTAPEDLSEGMEILPELTAENVEKITLSYHYYSPDKEDIVDYPLPDIWRDELISVLNRMVVVKALDGAAPGLYGQNQGRFFIHMKDGTVYDFHYADQFTETSPSGYAIENSEGVYTPLVTYREYCIIELDGRGYHLESGDISFGTFEEIARGTLLWRGNHPED